MRNRKEILVFDFETSGLSADKDKIIEMGAIKYENINGELVVTDNLQLLINSVDEVPEIITKITNITKEMLEADGVSESEGFHRLSSLINDETLLIAFNIQFDLGFLINLYKNNGFEFDFKNDILDVMAVYKDHYKFPHRLESAVSELGITIPNTHRALDDVKATFAVLESLEQKNINIKKYINVIGYNKKYGVSGPKFNHVKYIAQYGGYKEIERL